MGAHHLQTCHPCHRVTHRGGSWNRVKAAETVLEGKAVLGNIMKSKQSAFYPSPVGKCLLSWGLRGRGGRCGTLGPTTVQPRTSGTALGCPASLAGSLPCYLAHLSSSSLWTGKGLLCCVHQQFAIRRLFVCQGTQEGSPKCSSDWGG